MKKIEIKKGDKFYKKTKYGGIVHGEVERAFEMTSYNLPMKVVERKMKIVSTKGIMYDCDEIVFFTKELTDEVCKTIEKNMEGMRAAKEKKKVEMMSRLDKMIEDGTLDKIFAEKNKD